MDYKEVATKREYRGLLNSLAYETRELMNKLPEIAIYNSIYDQIINILEEINSGEALSEYDIYQRYSIGVIATKNFDCEEDIYGRKLQDTFGALFEYWNLPES